MNNDPILSRWQVIDLHILVLTYVLAQWYNSRILTCRFLIYPPLIPVVIHT